jgi:hypothetical protein
MTTTERQQRLDDLLWRSRIAVHIARHGGARERRAALVHLEGYRVELDDLVAGGGAPRAGAR